MGNSHWNPVKEFLKLDNIAQEQGYDEDRGYPVGKEVVLCAMVFATDTVRKR